MPSSKGVNCSVMTTLSVLKATWHNRTLTDGLEAVKWVGYTDEVLSVGHTAAGVIIFSFLSLRGEVRSAVDQPETLIFIQQHNT